MAVTQEDVARAVASEMDGGEEGVAWRARADQGPREEGADAMVRVVLRIPVRATSHVRGLEASDRPFIWVVKPVDPAEFERWLSDDGFETHVGEERGLVVTSWAPQKAILSHRATLGSMTHCGWNSTLECAAAGLPMVTWPHFAELFMNEKLVVNVLRVGVPVGIKATAKWGVEAEAVAVTREDVARAVTAVMDGAARRATAEALGKKARDAVARGGSSDWNVSHLVEHVLGQRKLVA
ncbi:hypothetical protein HU200_040621 [Digitaria exilis]|uniref:Uncharacterized protein n=1 Tax=Digitaria exilis TaxID=1010633 RepID=A0A835EGM1_9POAL|nr:hypothetical protein HU200_040621 [Digitaria exilis]